MTQRSTAEILLGGQPRALNAPVGAPSDTKFFGRSEALAAETINRGFYAVAKEVDDVFAQFLKLSRKAVTKGAQHTYTTTPLAPSNIIDDDGSTNPGVLAYSGLTSQDRVSSLFDLLNPGTADQYSESIEGAYTVYAVAATPEAPVAFQIRTLPAHTDV